LNTGRLAILVIALVTAVGMLILVFVWLRWLIRAFATVAAKVLAVCLALLATRRYSSPKPPTRREWFGS
jgi:hypothetical protein